MSTSKARKWRKSVKWRVDQDYRHKLDDEASAWLQKFTDEYYGADFRGPDPIHSPDQRAEIYRQQKAAWLDVTTQTNAEVTRHLSAPLKRPRQDGHRYLSPQDYDQSDDASVRVSVSMDGCD